MWICREDHPSQKHYTFTDPKVGAYLVCLSVCVCMHACVHACVYACTYVLGVCVCVGVKLVSPSALA